MSRTTLTRRLLAGFAATTLTLGLVACADEAEDDAPETTVETVEPAPEDPAAEETAADETAVDEADVDSADIELEDGTTVEVPVELADAVEEYSAEFGQATEIDDSDGTYLVTFEDADFLTYSTEVGAHPIVGEIAIAWTDDGGLNSDLGLAVDSEQPVDEGEGVTQQFQWGTITWTPGANGEGEVLIEEEEDRDDNGDGATDTGGNDPMMN